MVSGSPASSDAAIPLRSVSRFSMTARGNDPSTIDQLSLEHFSGGTYRECIKEADQPGHLGPSEPLPAMLPQLLFVHVHRYAQHNCRLQQLPRQLVRHALPFSTMQMLIPPLAGVGAVGSVLASTRYQEACAPWVMKIFPPRRRNEPSSEGSAVDACKRAMAPKHTQHLEVCKYSLQ